MDQQNQAEGAPVPFHQQGTPPLPNQPVTPPYYTEQGGGNFSYQATPIPPQPYTTNNNIHLPANQVNGIGIAGFVLSLVAIFLFLVPILNWILWILGAVLSIVGIFKKPNGLAIAGTVISFAFIAFFIILFVIGGFAIAIL